MTGANARDKDPINWELRKLPSVEKVLESDDIQPEIEYYPRVLVSRATQQVLSDIRAQISQGDTCPSMATVFSLIKQQLSHSWPGFLNPVINGTGVILHTNLGRAPLSTRALDSVVSLAGGYSNLETNLVTGKRGLRALEAEKLLSALTGAEAAMVVNNNAAALLLILVALAHDGEVIISRGELVQIGGGFRVPEVMEQSGILLQEVGTTNQTHIKDYKQAVSDRTALLLKVHQSNFTMSGFTHATTIPELKTLGAKHNLPVVYDLGSGALLNTEDFGCKHEPTVQEALADGADLVCFSGDKLLGGPQAGIILGRSLYLDRLRSHPLLRVIRIDKMSAAALGTTVKHYLAKEAVAEIPVWQMMAAALARLDARAQAITKRLTRAGIKTGVRDGTSMVGGGSMPEQGLASRLVAIEPPGPVEDFALSLRLARLPVIGRIDGKHLLLDVRTVLPSQDETLVDIIKEVSAKTG
jgi:L-seryl-tRNA(Ser) seleniumtransferase